ncbi:hypothetical protein [Streptomyces sp. NPDC048282]|uniref:hypothetical protein n=1 Tax=Streptomyces sp. NPDC048282 TaxID=3365528 RepID=UPI003718660D
MRRLVNNASGDCLASDYANGSSAVLMAACGGDRSGQSWTADDGHTQNQNRPCLGNYTSGTAIFMFDWGNENPSSTDVFWIGHVVWRKRSRCPRR